MQHPTSSSHPPLQRLHSIVGQLTPHPTQGSHSPVPAGQEWGTDIEAARVRASKSANYAALRTSASSSNSPRTLKGQTLFISGASRGIGLSIALRAARDGANVIIAAKTTEPHPNLPGTIYTAAEEVEKAGGKALAVACDIRSEESVKKAIEEGVKKFGGIDILVNNASAIALSSTEELNMKRYDLMHQINARGVFLCTKLCLPYLKKSPFGGHVLNLGPPLYTLHNDRWWAPHAAYTTAKYNMSVYTMAHAAEFKDDGIAVNSLWPLTTIATAAVANLLGGESMVSKSRTPDIMGDAAHAILTSKGVTGQCFIDEQVLKAVGVTDFQKYAVTKGTKDSDLELDFFV